MKISTFFVMILFLIAAPTIYTPAIWAQGPRIKDIAEVIGLQDNHLMGMGLVIGLKNTGDRSEASLRALQNMLKRQKFNISSSELAWGNVALVMVTATLPPLVKKGTKIDITVSSIGDAKSLAGGVLLSTLLKGLDQNVYAVAQGSVDLNSSLSTIAIATGGAIVEREVPASLTSPEGKILLRLNHPDFNTAARIAEVINQRFTQSIPCSQAVDMAMVKVTVPQKYLDQDRVAEFIAEIFTLPVMPDTPARIVINERTGTVIIGDSITITPVAIVHNQITIRITADDPKEGTVTIQKLVSALSALQVNPRDLIDILRMLKRAGALHAEIVVS